MKKIIIMMVLVLMTCTLTSCQLFDVMNMVQMEEDVTKKPAKENAGGGFKYQFDNEELVNNEFAYITAKESLKRDNVFELVINVENRLNADMSLSMGLITEEWCSVNGYMMEPYLMVDTIKQDGEITQSVMFSMDDFNLYGITELSDIQMRFLCIDNNDLLNFYESDLIKLTTPVADTYDYEKDTYLETLKNSKAMKSMGYELIELEENVYEENGIKIVSQAVIDKKYGGQYIYLEFQNDTDDIVRGEISTKFLNGLELENDGDRTVVLNPGTRSVKWFSVAVLSGYEDEEVLNVREIEEFEYDFEFENYEDGDTLTSGSAKLAVED